MADVNANIDVNIDTSLALAQLKSLQRQISQFHTSISRSSETAALAQKSLQKNFLNSVNAIGSFSAELRTVKTTTESFTSSLEGNKFSMREYFRYAGGATKTFGRLFKSEFDTIGKVAEERVKRLQTQYIKMGRDASGAMQAVAITPTSLNMQDYGTKTAIAAQKQALFNQLMKQGSTNLLNFGKNTQWAGRQLMVGFTIPLAMVGSAATKTFMDMEAQAIKFKKVYGDLFTPKEETKEALENIIELGRSFTKYGVAVSTTVGLAAEAAAAGFAGLDLQRQTTEATRLSILGQIDTQKALETTIALQNAFGTSSDKLAESIDFLNAVENQTVVSLDDITTAIPRVAPIIQQLGGDVKDLAFFLTAMKEGGINASQGANALKSGLAALINPTGKAVEMLERFGINIRKIVVDNKGDLKNTVNEFATALNQLDPLNRAQAIEQMFGKFQFARLSALFANVTKEGNQAARVLDLANSSVEELSALSEQELGLTADSAMNKFKKTVEDLKFALIPVGQAFLEAVTPIVEFVGNVLEKFANLSDGTKKAITLMATVIGALGPILLMTFGLLANGVANIIKLFLTLRNGYLRLTGQSQILGESTQYLTMEQIEAAAASHSLNQAHATLTQQFTAEASAVNQLILAYQNATKAAAAFAMTNPGAMRPPIKKFANGGIVGGPGTGTSDSIPAYLSNGEYVIKADAVDQYGAEFFDKLNAQKLAKGGLINLPGYFDVFKDKVKTDLFENLKLSPKEIKEKRRKQTDEYLKNFFSKIKDSLGFAKGGIVRGEGTGTSDSIPAMISNGEAIIPAAMAKKYAPLIQGMIAGNIPGYSVGRTGTGTQSTNPFVSGHVAGFEPTQLPQTVKNLQNVMEALSTSTNKQEVAMRTLIEDVLTSSIGVQNFGEVVDGVAIAQADVIRVLNIAEKNAAMISGGVGARITGNARNEAFRQGRISEPITFRQAREGVATVRPIVESGQLASGKAIMPKYLAELQNLIITTDSLSTEQEQAQFGLSNMRKIIADQIVAANKSITQEDLGVQVNARMDDLTEDLIATGAARFNSETGLIESMDDYKAELVFAAKQLKTASLNNLGAATTSIPGINQATRVAMRSKPSDIQVQLNRKDPRSRLAMAGKRTDAALKTALQGSIPGLQNAGEDLGDAITHGVAIGAQTTSPSKKTTKVGEDIARGLEVGMQNRQDDVARVGESLGKTATQSTSRGVRTVGNVTPGTTPALEKITGGVTVGQVAQGFPISPDITAKVAQQGKIIQASSDRLRGLDRNIMGASFAISSLSGIASMTGGRFAGLAGTISKVTAAMFALQAITGLLTQTNAIALVQKRLEIAQSVGANALAAGPMFGGLSKALSGRSGLIGIISRVGLRLAAFLGPVGMAIAAVGAVYAGFKFFKNRSDRAALAAEGLANAMTLTADKVKTLAELLGQTPTARAGSGARISANQLDAGEQTAVDELRKSEEFLKTYKKDILAIKNATVAEAQIAFNAIALDLSGQGFTKEAIKTYIDALAEEANKTKVALKFKQIDLSKEEGVAAAVKLAKDVTTGLSKAFKGKIIPLPLDENFSAGATATTKIKLSTDLQKELNVSSALLGNTLAGLTSAFGKQTIKADEYNAAMLSISENIPKGNVGMLFMEKLLKNINPTIAKASTSIKDYDTKMLLLRASLVNASIAQEIFDKLMSENPKLVAAARAELEKYRIATDALANQVVVTTKDFEDQSTAIKEKSPFQQAIDQLKQQKKEMIGTVKAYSTLRNAGVAAGKAFEIAKDPILAAAINSTKVGTAKWKELIKLIKETDAALIKSKLTELRADTAYTEQFTKIVPVLKNLGLNAEEINNIFADPTFAQQFINSIKNGKVQVADLEKLIKATIKDRKGKIILETSLKTEDELFDDAMSKANEMFDKVQAGIEAQYRGQVTAGETAVSKAQTSIDDIQKEIDGIQTTIDKKQRDLEFYITREIEKFQTQIDTLQNTIKEKFEIPLTKLSDEGDILSNTLSLIDRQTSKINEKYDAQAAALTKISEINSEIAGQQKQQIGLADALSRGDIAAAAAAAQEMRATAAANAQGRQSGILESARSAELAGVTVNGMTRAQIEERQFQISQQSFALQQQRKIVEQEIADIERNQIAPLNVARVAAEKAIRDEQDKIYTIQQQRLIPAQAALTIVEEDLKATQEKLKADLAIIEQNKQAWDDAKTLRDLENFEKQKYANEYKDVLTKTDGVAKGVLDKILALNTTVKTIHNIHTTYTSSGGSSVGTPFGQAGSLGTAKKMYGGKVMPMNYGGMVPKYMAMGGRVGSDSVPAMLTPGEFVMNKAATKRFGPMLENMNNSKYPSMIKDLTPTTYTNVNSSMVAPIINNVSTSVSDNSSTMYNYNVGINVNESNASSADIARAVIGQIKYIDSQRIRGQR